MGFSRVPVGEYKEEVHLVGSARFFGVYLGFVLSIERKANLSYAIFRGMVSRAFVDGLSRLMQQQCLYASTRQPHSKIGDEGRILWD